ncbi:hypothetical protein HW555_004592 [Spodoptera exigua]|uniref:Regulatory protein zeste n=1 Tax=Spodoptera exigua TaxID=7107 RepID=A0A835L873_SPOEX|nr:hypothetical protein HW555_004592 [Spodoptera exigua]
MNFIESHGDLSKPSRGPRSRRYVQQKWKELTDLLNSDGTGDSLTEEMWAKVWSDYKNNLKYKLAQKHSAARGTVGWPALLLTLTDLEKRVLNIIGVQAVTGMPIPEAGFTQFYGAEESSLSDKRVQVATTETAVIVGDDHVESTPIREDIWNTPGTSSQPTVAPIAAPMPSYSSPPKKKKKAEDSLVTIFKEYESNARQYKRERDRIAEELERERIRQRDVELQLQAQWLDFMKEALKVLVAYLEK